MPEAARVRTSAHNRLATQVMIGIIAGIALGYFWPHTGVAMKPLADWFKERRRKTEEE